MKIILALAVLITAISPSEAAWKKTVTRGGKTTVTGDAETMARHEKDQKARAAYDKEIAAAPRRAAADPIRVVFVNPTDEKERKKQGLDKLHAALLAEFAGDPILKIQNVDLPAGKSAGSEATTLEGMIAAANQKGKSGDVYVYARVGSEDVYGISKTTKKLATAKALVYSAQMRPHHGTAVKDAKEMGSLFQNVQIVKNLAKKIGDTIKTEIGPTLPSSQAVAEINKKHMSASLREQTGIEEGDDAKTVLKKLFKPRQPKP